METQWLHGELCPLVTSRKVGNGLSTRLGRVVDALGSPIDGAGPINTKTRRRVELKAGL